MIDAAELKRLVDAWANRKVSEHVVSDFLMANLDAIIALAEAAGVRLVYVGEAKAQLIDGDERTSVRIFTPYAPPQKEQTHESD